MGIKIRKLGTLKIWRYEFMWAKGYFSLWWKKDWGKIWGREDWRLTTAIFRWGDKW